MANKSCIDGKIFSICLFLKKNEEIFEIVKNFFVLFFIIRLKQEETFFIVFCIKT